MAYANLAATVLGSARIEESIAWASRALELAERLGDTETAVHALSTIGLCESGETGTTRLLQALERAQQAELPEQAGRAFSLLALMAVGSHRQAAASRYIAAGIDYCSDNGQELYRLYLLAYRSRLELDQGRWSDAADSATAVLRIPRTSTTPRITALVVLGLVRARRGDPGHRAALEEAWALAEPTGELPRLGPVAAARAEAAWLKATATRSTWPPPRHSHSPSNATPNATSISSACGGGVPASTRICPRDSRNRTSGHSPGTRSGPPNGGAKWAVPTRPPWRSPTTTRRRSAHGDSRFVGQAVPEMVASVSGPEEVVVDLAGDVTLQAADDLGLGLAFFEASFDVDLGGLMGAEAGEDDSP